MIMNIKLAVLGVTTLVLATNAGAATLLQVSSVTSSEGSFSGFDIGKTIDQSGLSASYVSGVTDFNSFVSGTTTIDGANNGWFSPGTITTSNIDFDLGGSFNIESFALWNDFQNVGQNINAFNLWADDNAGFATPVLLGSFNAIVSDEPLNFGQIFNFGVTDASHVRMEILSNYGSTFVTGFSEAAFGITAVPVPAAVWLFGSGLLGLVAVARRKV